ncbi:hypothetical protein [Legionella sp. W05-934-2]|uniref:hypothetical protein n=1 Tax=Legionella sp. W05-934-2 TaxID=1198649 RepID=UPI003462C514
MESEAQVIINRREKELNEHNNWWNQTLSWNEKETIRSRIRLEYSSRFDNSVKPELENQWKKKVKDANFVGELERFYQRHPWLSSLANQTHQQSLSYKYIKSIIQNTLKHKSDYYDNHWRLDNLDGIPSIRWPRFDHNKFQKRLHDYPLKKLIKNKFDLFSSLPSLNKAWPTLQDPTAYRFSRLDIYRLLFQHFNIQRGGYVSPQATYPTVEGQKVACVMPVELNELDQLDEISKSHCHSWLINIGDTNKPFWIFLDKHQNTNTLYVPSNLTTDPTFITKLNTIREVFPVNAVVEIENDCGTSYAHLPKDQIWQYQLFARVLPYCIKSNRTEHLDTYRNNISLNHLIAYVWESLLPISGTTLSKTKLTAKRFQYAEPFSETPWHQLITQGEFYDDGQLKALKILEASSLLDSVDRKSIRLLPNQSPDKDFTLATVIERENFVQACFMACFQPVSQMALTLTPASKNDMPDVPMYIFDKVIERLNYVSFDIQSDHEAINPGHFPPIVRLSNAAACNRLLHTAYKIPLAELPFDDRWLEAGKLTLQLFKQHSDKFDSQAIQRYLQLEKGWRKEWFNPNKAPKSDAFEWQLAQFAQMGRLGLDAFFDHLRDSYLKHWHSIHETPQLNIPVLFDLNGDRLISSAQYIEHLNEQLTNFINDERCIPKFSKIHLILPHPSTRATYEETSKLLRTISDCKYQFDAEADTINLYEFKILSEQEQDAWLLAFENLATLPAKPLIALIRIPELDEQISQDVKANQLKTRYRALQNKILDNQRLHHQKQLAENTAIFYQGANGTLDPMVDIRNRKHRVIQPFHGQEETFLLAANTPGIQQELQQNVEARHEIVQQVENKRVVYEEKAPEIKRYPLDLSRLVTRTTVQDYFKFSEASVNWRKEFSQWVGSDIDIANTIQYIEPEALEKIRQHRANFQMGIVLDHLPFGFYLAYHPKANNAYILCYDEKRYKQERYEWEGKSKELRNPFTPHLDSKEKAVNFAGDFRQFHLLGDKEDSQVSFWHHLASHSIASEFKQKQTECLRNIYKTHINNEWPDISLLMMRHEVAGNIKRPVPINSIKEYIGGWAQGVLGYDKATEFIKVFTDSLDASQLKSFGQLCYYFDTQKEGLGSQHFLRIAYTLYKTFGQQHFTTWQKVIFANSDNASELLTKPILDAMGLSLITLKDKSPAYINIWFRLLETQAKQTGFVRYDRLWYAYQTLISYIDARQLTINEDVVARLIDSKNPFEAVVWLDRLYHCLKMSEGQLYETTAQQAILDNIDKIDWSHNGLYYAMRHNQAPYWTNDLALTQFQYGDTEKGYEPIWDELIPQKGLAVQFGRYLSTKLRINYKQYQHYAKDIQPLLENKKVTYPVARLLLIHLTHGNENIAYWDKTVCQAVVKSLCHENMKDVVDWLNRQFKLDNANRENHYHVHYNHLPLIVGVLKKYGLSKLDKYPENKRIASLNALGKTCQYLESQSLLGLTNITLKLTHMLGVAIDDENYLTAMRQTPWLLMAENQPWEKWPFSSNLDVQVCQKRLLTQLESIAFGQSTWLPDRKAILSALSQLDEKPLSLHELDTLRRQIIAQWVNHGCDIQEQDAAFRELTNKEQEQVQLQLSEQLLPQHANENATLIARLVPHLAIEANLITPEQAFTQLVAQFKRIDNKPHFNDLAIVLGGLLQHIQKQAPAKMSLQQLTDILESLMQANHDELSHFPSDMLSQVVAQTGKQLTNQNLNSLSAKCEPTLKNLVKTIVNAQIANQVRPTLLKMQAKGMDKAQFEWIISHFVIYQLDAIDIHYQTDMANALLSIASLTPEVRNPLIDRLLYLPNDFESQTTWLKSRHQLLMNLTKTGSIAPLQRLAPFMLGGTQTSPDIEVIAIHTLKSDATHGPELLRLLQKLSHTDLKKLATYCANPPKPSADYLIKELPHHSVDELIHQFETIDQANGLRHFSVTEPEKNELKRILGGIKEKNSGYISDEKQKQIMGLLYYVNAYAQEHDIANISSETLKTSIRQTAQWLQASTDETTQITYRLQLLSMLREVLLRQTGKWANHTQMLDLIYAALHNDESLFHQVKTGQGKSIITILRVAFHALNGKVVDVFTAKESLSSRDHEEFGYILDAIGIEHTHILPNSDENDYKVGDDVFGAINYMTPGSFSLYQSGHCWSENSKRYINYRSKERVAFFDEGDHVLLDEQTMFNFSFGGDSGKLYNYDAWVYQATWRYFQTVKETLPINENGIPYISRTKHLKELCEFLQKQADFAPVQSTFIKKYLAPVVDNEVTDKKAAILERDKILASLLSAAFTANNLQENRDFCIQTDTTTLSDGLTLEGRIAKVVINNQVQGGATYSERVHQFLHVRLNEEAIANNEQPNFFIAPDSDIVLSQNVPSLIKHYYGQIEGCSGTMGDAGDLAVYQERYNINHVVKLPTHELSQTTYLGMIFCEGQDNYEQAIVNWLKQYQQQPTLLVSEDDIAVKALSSRLAQLLPKEMVQKLICDTNDSGQLESDILPLAGKAGAIVNSSRMARGTDIKPETEAGLLVIRANANIPRFAKQSGGRQGRNGAKGVLIDIIDFAKIKQSFQHFEQSNDYALRLKQLMEREALHLKKKIEKHQKRGSHKWDWLLNNEENQTKYLKTRVVHYLKHEIKIAREQNIRSKEAIVSECSSHVIAQLMHHIGEDQVIMNAVRQDWLRCRALMESAWQQRMNGAVADNEIVLNAFYEKATLAWQWFACKYPDYLDASLLDDKETLLKSVKSMTKLAWNNENIETKVSTPTQKDDMTEVIHFYQDWLTRVGPKVLSDFPKSLQNLFYGPSKNGLNDLDVFYKTLVKASQHNGLLDSSFSVNDSQALFKLLSTLPVTTLTYIPLAYMSQVVETFDIARTSPGFVDKLSCLSQLFDHPCAQSVENPDAHHMSTLGETSLFLMRLACRGFINHDSDGFRRFTSQQSISHIADILWERDWETLTPNQFACFDRFINQDTDVAKLLTTRLSKQHWQTLLGQLGRYDMNKPEDRDYFDTVLNYFKQHHVLLNNTYPETINALLDIFFHYPHRRIDASQFLAPDCLKNATDDDNIHFIHFIAEQYMLNAQEILQLETIIDDAYGKSTIKAAEMKKELMPQIRSLPANIPFSLISKRVTKIADDQNSQTIPHAMKALRELGEALNQFTIRKGITTSENSLPEEGLPETLLKKAQAIILDKESKNKLDEATIIFRQLSQPRYDEFDAYTCLLAYEQHGSHYESALSLLLRAKHTLTSDAYANFFSASFSPDEEKTSLDDLSRIITLFEQHNELFAAGLPEKAKQQNAILAQCLQRNGIESVMNQFNSLKQSQLSLNNAHVWHQWQTSMTKKLAFAEQIQLIKQAGSLAPSLKERVCTLYDEGYDPARLSVFINLVKHDSKTMDKLSLDQWHHLLSQWEAHHISDNVHLTAVYEAQKIANTLESETPENAPTRLKQNIPTYESLFGTLNQENNGTKRMSLMHSITHSLISFSASLQEKCWSFYQTLISKVGDIKKQMDQLPESQRARGLSHLLRSIKSLTMELAFVAKPESHPTELGDNVFYYDQLVHAYEQQYTGSWLNYFTINRTRWQQAQSLFSELKSLTHSDEEAIQPKPKAAFYESMLVALSKTQQAIIDNDGKNRIANQKGYSRLLDITQQLGLQVCKDIINDASLSHQTKQKAKDWLTTQEKRIIHQLWQRLDSRHPLVVEIQPYARNTDADDPAAIHRCKQAILKLNASDLPNELRYLLPMLQGHFAISGPVEQQANFEIQMR